LTFAWLGTKRDQLSEQKHPMSEMKGAGAEFKVGDRVEAFVMELYGNQLNI
jgi:ribosomal protein S1